MYPFSEHRPDCRVFFKRLVTPDPEAKKKISQGMSHMSAVDSAFNNYYPVSFRKKLLEKYIILYGDWTVLLEKDIADETKLIKELEQQVANIGRFSMGHLPFPQLQEYTKKAEQLASQRTLLKKNQQAYSTIRPLYEPYLLELVIGLVSVSTTISRDSNGTASLKIQLPLGENGFVENILYGIENTEMFDSAKMAVKSIVANQMLKITKISSRELSIFKLIRDADVSLTNKTGKIDVTAGPVLYTDRRECSLLPSDMVQIYFTKRYADDAGKTTVSIPQFPQDYIPGFTGFIINTSVEFSAGQSPTYTITIKCTDIAHPLRISRANLDPACDPQFRPEDTNVQPYVSKYQSYGDELVTGPKIIEELVVGKPGSWGGVSQIEVTDTVQKDMDTGQYTHVKLSSNAVKTYTVSMPWEFDRIPLNLYTDLINIWSPYVAAFKTSWRLWESDYKLRWDICKEIADVMEFELYADNFGAINYHPPLYNLNPVNMQYFIEDKDIISEQHSFVETPVVTAVEVVSQPNFGVPANIAKNLSAFALADDEWIQRYGIRFRSKSIPILSGTDKYISGDQEQLHKTRYLFARAWLNRRNLEVQSATVEIPGTPEYFLCNSVAFVGDYGEFLAKLASSTVAPISNKALVGVPLSGTSNKLNSSYYKQAKKLVDNLKVYYISGVSHKYTQGGSFTTSLHLTHGRIWSKRFNVGYAFTEDESDELLKNIKQLYLNRQNSDFDELMKAAIASTSKTLNRQYWGKLDLFTATPAMKINQAKKMVKKKQTPATISIQIPDPADFSVFNSGGGTVKMQ